jgi:RNA polymerase sigma-70 factor, ECF subfamily
MASSESGRGETEEMATEKGEPSRFVATHAPSEEPPAPPPDRPLVDASLKGDLKAFEALIARYQKAIFHIVLYKCRNYFDAEDLTQDIFLAAYRALPTLKDLDNFGGWLFGIAHNRANKWYQRQKTKIIKFQEIQRRKADEAHARPVDPADGPTAQEVLSQSLQKLPSDVRQVLMLKYFEGQSYDAIEERLGLNFHRIDYLIRKGKALLRQKVLRAVPDMDAR